MTENLSENDLPEPGEIDPNPGPELQDPELEQKRAEDAAERERESQQAELNKFEELRQEDASRDAARIVGDVPPPRENDSAES